MKAVRMVVDDDDKRCAVIGVVVDAIIILEWIGGY